MIIEDLFETNSKIFITELTGKVSKIKSVMNGTKEGGDYRETLQAHLSILESSLDAAKTQYDLLVKTKEQQTPIT